MGYMKWEQVDLYYNGSDSTADLAIIEIFLCLCFLLYKMGTTILQRK